MKIGVDFDGVLFKNNWVPSIFREGRINLPWFIYFLGIIVADLFSPPNERIINILKEKSCYGSEIIVIPARPSQLQNRTKRRLEKYHVPFDSLITVGPGKGLEQRKLDVIRAEQIDFFVDDDPKTVAFLLWAGVKATTEECFVI